VFPFTDLIQARGWGKSTLIVDKADEMPRNITAATDKIQHVNLM
jgi:large subunit ribosomal protein L4